MFYNRDAASLRSTRCLRSPWSQPVVESRLPAPSSGVSFLTSRYKRNYESHGVLIMNPEDTLVPPGRGDLSGEGRSSSPVHGGLATHRGLTRQSPSSPLGSPTRPLGRLQSLGRDLTLGIFFVSFLGVGFGGETSRRERYCVMSSTPSSLFWFFSKNLLNNEIHTIKKYFVDS